jgi:hypothetical protein
MNEVYFHAVAYELPASPGGLLGPRWVLSHHCKICRARVEAGDLLAHAKAHAFAGGADRLDPSRCSEGAGAEPVERDRGAQW